ncbi:phenylacetate--CoA ligase family protein [Roseateles sp. BYS180W]|uniref:Phenylacetate--CoA ligase family protein n=1 Tax=Roseateles rivi TaxID=3299028 RepID=A0ABW7FW33_9BURK
MSNPTTSAAPAGGGESIAPPSYFDEFECQRPEAREQRLMQRLPQLIAQLQDQGLAQAEMLGRVEAQRINSRAALAGLPVTRKHDLMQRQHAAHASGGDPFGGFSAIGWQGLLRPHGARRVFQSPGPLYEPEGRAANYWRMARALHAAGFRSGDLVHNSFSYHLTPAGAMMDGSAQALGCTVFPGGVGNTEQQLQAMLHLRPQAYTGTPSFLKILLERAIEHGHTLSLSKALLSGEALPWELHEWLRRQGVAAYQCYATADLGLIAYETRARQGLVLDEDLILEIVRPGGTEPLPEGEVGEVVITNLNPDYPLVRFGTGDLSAVLPGTSLCGRTNTRLKGWLGRADQSAKVRGMFVHAGQVADIARRLPELGRLRLVVRGQMSVDELVLRAELLQQPAPEGLAARAAEVVREVTRLRAEVELLPPGSLPNDGRLVDDTRPLP